MSNGSSAGGSIEVDGVDHEYRDERSGNHVHALGGVSFSVAAGEFVTLLGPSGCGKSTLLYLIAGLRKPTEGRILLDGNVVRGPGSDRGMVFQDYALLPWLTVLGNVALGLKIQGVAKAERTATAKEYIRLVGLEGFDSKYPHELSGGMRQRVAVARTLASGPSAVLMDEPFAAVDAQTRMDLQEELVRIWQETRKTVIFVTHSVEEAAYLGDRVVVLTSRPGVVRDIVDIPVPRGERREAAHGPEYSALTTRLLGLVRGDRK